MQVFGKTGIVENIIEPKLCLKMVRFYVRLDNGFRYKQQADLTVYLNCNEKSFN